MAGRSRKAVLSPFYTGALSGTERAAGLAWAREWRRRTRAEFAARFGADTPPTPEQSS